MVTNPPPTSRTKVLLLSTAYLAVVACFLWIFSQFYIPGKAFTYMIMFGDQRSESYLPELRSIDHYEMDSSFGYDAQHYAQIAMRPDLDDPELAKAVDNLPYRARRILLSWTASLLAGGDPLRALHIFSLQNVVAWVLLAILMLHWFPPTSLSHFVRWSGVLMSFGMCFSVRGALVDGPSLLLIALAVLLFEKNRTWWASAVLAIASLGKETNILAGAIVVDASARSWRKWLTMAGQGLLILAPLLLWMYYLKLLLGSGGGAGTRNFELPFVAYFNKWVVTLEQLGAEGFDSVAKWSLLMLIALTVQFLYFVIRPQLGQPWWRVGISYSVLMVALGDAVWEGYPGAASRVLLPMTLAFNVLLPRGRAWLVPLILGNLTVFTIGDALKPPGGASFEVEGPGALRIAAASGQPVTVLFDEGWYQAERSRFEYWRWSTGPSKLVLQNPHNFALRVDLSFQLRSNNERLVQVKSADQLIWEGSVTNVTSPEVVIPDLRLEPGATVLVFDTDQPAVRPSEDDLRSVAFSLRDLIVRIRAEVP